MFIRYLFETVNTGLSDHPFLIHNLVDMELNVLLTKFVSRNRWVKGTSEHQLTHSSSKY